MKKLFPIVLLLLISMATKAQNKDSLAFDNYFKQAQKNFKYIKAIDSIISIVDYLKKDNARKDVLIAKYGEAAENVKENLKLYSFLIKKEKDGLRNLNTDTSGYFSKTASGYRLTLKYDTNLETLKSLIGEAELRNQLPLLFSDIDKGKIEVLNEDAIVVAPCCGMRLPDWPPNNNLPTIPKEQLEQLYRQQESYINAFYTINECSRKFRDWFIRKQAVLRYPQQIMQLIQNQIVFKHIIESQCSK